MKRNETDRRILGLRKIVVMFLLLVAHVGAQSDSAPPNIVYINADDLGWADLGCQGSGYYLTPHIDQLAKEGMVFSNAYAAASNCAPSRASVMTGQYTPRHGVYTVLGSARGKAKHRRIIPTKNTLFIDKDNLTIAHALKRRGYATASVGKWHISNDPTEHGFDLNVAGDKEGSPKGGGYHSPFHRANLVEEEKGHYLTDRLTDHAVRWIGENKARPFFLYVPYYSVHTPIQAKKAYTDQFKKREGTKAHNRAAYAAMIKSLDEGVGRILAALAEHGLTKNTLVVFTSDNGGVWKISRQWPLRAGKGSYYEGGIRVPLIVRWPGHTSPGSRCDTNVSGIDFFPTLMSVSGATVPEGKVLDGVDLVPLLKGKELSKDRPLFWHFPIYLQGRGNENRDLRFRTRPGAVVRLGDWKLHEYFEDGALELYNLKLDPGEQNNLAFENKKKAAELHAMMMAWRKRLNAPVPRDANPEYDPTAD